MKRKICPRCGNRFTPDDDWKVLCARGDWGCSDEVDLYDPDAVQVWRGLSLILNAKMSPDHWEDVADSAGGTMFLNQVWKHKDHDTKINWMLQKSKEVT